MTQEEAVGMLNAVVSEISKSGFKVDVIPAYSLQVSPIIPGVEVTTEECAPEAPKDIPVEPV